MHGNAVVALLKLLVVAEHCFRSLDRLAFTSSERDARRPSVRPDALEASGAVARGLCVGLHGPWHGAVAKP